MILPIPLELRPDPGPAQDWVRNELAKPEYQPSLMQRITDWFWGLLDKVIGAARHVGLLSPVVALGLAVVLVLVIAFVLARLRREPASPDATRALLEDTRTTAAEYRARAGSALAEERWDDAVVDGLRAIAVGLVERALADDLPSATADEVAAAAGGVFPTERASLVAAARLFDDVRYGDRHATRAGANDLLDLERRLRALRPESSGSGPLLAVPR
ncbi:MAG: DUF4129 domain-containing protein [Marmoricola sp.]